MDAPLRQLVTEMAKAEREVLSAHDFEPQKRRFLDYAEERQPRRRARYWLAFGAAVASLASVWFWLGQNTARFETNGARGRVGALLTAPASEGLELDFSDGSRLNLRRQGLARVVGLDERGAHLRLESGSLLASVEHAESTRWQVDAGPFTVHVVGTRFEVRWDPKAQNFVLKLHEGSVKVNGPELSSDCVVSRGGEVRIGLSQGERAGNCVIPRDPTALSEPASPSGPAATEPTPTPLDAEAARPSRSRAEPRLPSNPNRWRGLAARGEYAEAWAAIRAEGFERVTERASAPELLRVADAARFTGQPGRGSQALLVLRRRFSGSPEARDAAFLLGRIAADQQGAPERGARWFSTYLGESAGGALASEALGRLLDCQLRAGQMRQARRTAEQYLERYPSGSYRALAEHHLREQPGSGSRNPR